MGGNILATNLAKKFKTLLHHSLKNGNKEKKSIMLHMKSIVENSSLRTVFRGHTLIICLIF